MPSKQAKPKESSKEKKQRKKEFAQIQKQIRTIVLPTIAAVVVFIFFYVYMKTRPDYVPRD